MPRYCLHRFANEQDRRYSGTVVRYNVGGRFDIHSDSTPGRLLSWITFLDDVEAGGAFLLVHYNITVKPEKGAAVLWYNLLKSGEYSEFNVHTGCPVLYGQKWITKSANYITTQTLDKCALDKNEYYSVYTN